MDLIGMCCVAVVGTSDKTDKKEMKPINEQYSVIRNLLAIEESIDDDDVISH